MAHREEIGHLESRLDAAEEANRHGSEQYDNLEEEFRQCQLTNREQELDLAYVDNKANIAIDQAGKFLNVYCERILTKESLPHLYRTTSDTVSTFYHMYFIHMC